MARFRRHSLYWRIAVGFMLSIAVMLGIQGVVLLWLIARADPDSRTNFTLRVANDLARALTDTPTLDVDAFIHSHYATPPRPFYVVMTDRTTVFVGDKRPLPGALENVHNAFTTANLKAIPRSWEAAPYWAAPILVNGIVVGTVAVVPQNLIDELAPMMTALAVVLVVMGTVVASRFIFAPAHRRLKDLEHAAQELGGGNLQARAEEEGGDEVSSLARTFNAMARDLATRAEQIALSDRTRRLLLADVSHELMTPLTAIRGYQEKLISDPTIRASAPLSRHVAVIGEETLRVERLMRDLLDLARLDGGGTPLDMQDVSVEALFGRVAARHEAEAQARGARLTTHIEPGAEIGYGDPFRLEQALQNLAANALRHVGDNGQVALSARLDGGQIEITVRDDGGGIAAEHLPFIFDRFYKVDPARVTASAGSGLGLSIVKAIVERHGGTVTVASTVGLGTVFTIRIPAGVQMPSESLVTVL